MDEKKNRTFSERNPEDGTERMSFRERSAMNRKNKSLGGVGRFIRENSRSAIIMVNAALILIVVIIAMGIQLYRLDHGKKNKPQQIETESASDGGSGAGDKNDGSGSREDGEADEKQNIPADASVAQKPEVIRQDLDPEKPMVALTFDDGPYDVVTDRIVKVLAQHDARATFFVVGNRVPRYSDSMKNAYDHGNQIATHTYDHGNLSKMSKKKIQWELKKASRTMKKVTGANPTMLRPPYGTVNRTMRTTIKMPMIFWNVDTQDWSSRNKKKILQRCKVISDGDIVLMHDLYPSTADAVKVLVPRLKKKGFQLVTVEELFYYKKIDAKGGKSYYSGK